MHDPPPRRREAPNERQAPLSDYKKPIPKPTPETQEFWAGCKEGKLILQRCNETGRAYFPPRPFSPYT
ncbi:zinc ribbon domain-containing protein, partial [Pseudomonas sp. AH2 (2023)]|uniref:zinc ribbon domain-containing protein n=1 Tax=Pseudomonas sp. AH2 (2023) TaxID=3048599 RepID=UPI0034DD448B